LSLILIGFELKAARANAGAAATVQSGPAPNYRLVLATFILFGLYIGLLPKLGFRISTVLFMLALQISLEWPRSPLRWLVAIVVALAASLICYYVFESYLSVLLPRGTWSGM
jgi:multisubunit Na+/H+ antiporter MnhB subunit